ncbi:hypothetical protein [Blastopirellula retiformator]|uniref:Carboxypeptidase regulatory-like domain-containing protein n=1 Tax=Blastopirellula retiformator TaxID=2527970 RepID=A0A5C5V4X0_9BACT|nr:hypothetical protein [Blastopirellula retiformator]TWT32817.1 hypothetical protein Enr8_26230 [Blastopirellula retiformator]
MKATNSPSWAVLLSALAIFLIGCGKPAPNIVSGSVTMNGTPVEQGEIMFLPTDGKGVVAAGPIVNGSFSMECQPGDKSVKITATKEQGIAPDGLPNYVSYIPAKYNTQTTLNAKVADGNNDEFNFDLK